jgi:hypothetical protein
MRDFRLVNEHGTDAHDGFSDIGIALTRARRTVEARRQRREAQGHEASEVLQTDWLCDAAWPHLEYTPFNPRQEGVVGADWLWWFLDTRGECFGVLIQAKRLRGSVGNWTVDLAYPDRTGEQMAKLFAAADRFDVPPAYILYCGDQKRRTDLECRQHQPPACSHCERAGVSILSGLAAERAVMLAMGERRQIATSAYAYAIPLEDIVQPAVDPVYDLHLLEGRVSGELREFLVQPQDGARGVAKRFFAVVAAIRMGQASAAGLEVLRIASDKVFDVLPGDVGHFGRPYYEFVFRGLRRRLPDYVLDLGQQIGDQVPVGIHGIVIAHV